MVTRKDWPSAGTPNTRVTALRRALESRSDRTPTSTKIILATSNRSLDAAGLIANDATPPSDRPPHPLGVKSEGISALTAAELRLLPLLTTHLTFGEIGERRRLSWFTVKSHAMSINYCGITIRGAGVRGPSETPRVPAPTNSSSY
jgi:DNA-binding CsgD family transcriptional regulator